MQEATAEWELGVLAITHFRRLLAVLRPDVVHVLSDGRVVASGSASWLTSSTGRATALSPESGQCGPSPTTVGTPLTRRPPR